MTIESTKIYSRGVDGSLRYWLYEVDGGQWRGHSGIEGGKDVASKWTTSKPKNVGRVNATTAEEQAALEAEAEFRKKLDREYRRTPEELDGVPPAPMLAEKFKDAVNKQKLRYHPGGYIRAQPKLDGIRMLTRADGGFSREYQPFSSVSHLIDFLAPIAKAEGVIFDGELYNHAYKDDFNSISSLVRKTKLSGEEQARVTATIQYHLYDLAIPGMRYAAREYMLRKIAEKYLFEFEPIVLVPSTICDDREAIDAAHAANLANGYEGTIVRLNEEYEFGTHSWHLLKHKDFFDAEFPVMRLIMGEGNWAGIPKSVEIMAPGDARTEKGERPKASIKGSQEFCRSLIDMAPKFCTVRYPSKTPAGVPRFGVAVDFHQAERKD